MQGHRTRWLTDSLSRRENVKHSVFLRILLGSAKGDERAMCCSWVPPIHISSCLTQAWGPASVNVHHYEQPSHYVGINPMKSSKVATNVSRECYHYMTLAAGGLVRDSLQTVEFAHACLFHTFVLAPTARRSDLPRRYSYYFSDSRACVSDDRPFLLDLDAFL